MEVSKNKSSFFDVICKFDNQFYGHKLKWFIIHSIFIVIAFNFCEFFKLNSSPWDIIVVIAYFFMIIITFLAWIGSWRDDDGNWSWNRFSFKLKMYLILWKKSQNKIKNKSGKEYLYYLGAFLFLFGACSKAIYLLTLYLRFLSKDLISINLLNNYVVFFNFSFWIGIAILIYLAIKHKEVFDVKSFFNKKKFDNVSLNLVKSNEANLININNDHQVNQLKEINRNTLIGEIVNILQNWKPDQYDKEWKYQDDLENHVAGIAAAVDDLFEQFEQVAEDDHLQGVVLATVQLLHQREHELVGLAFVVMQAIVGGLHDIQARFAELPHHLVEGLGRLLQQLGLLAKEFRLEVRP